MLLKQSELPEQDMVFAFWQHFKLPLLLTVITFFKSPKFFVWFLFFYFAAFFLKGIMDLFESAKSIERRVSELKEAGKLIGFVPTMGALHQGHLSLVNQAANHCDVVVVSIFVNPTQFNNADDLKRYPRVLNQDVKLLETTACELLFVPSVHEIYPSLIPGFLTSDKLTR